MDIAPGGNLHSETIEAAPIGDGAPPGEEAQESVTKLEVSAAATSMPTDCQSADSTEALRRFRVALLEMVGASENISEKPAQEKTGWLGSAKTSDDLSCATLVARYVSLWSVLEKPENQRFSVQALIGLQMIRKERMLTASKIFREIEFQTSTPAALSYVMRGIGTFLMFFTMAVVIVAVFPLALEIVSPRLAESWEHVIDMLGPNLGKVVVAFVAGMFGSVVSLLLRISEFEATRGRSQMFLKLTGATLPIVGGLFGAFIAALFCAEIVNISIGRDGISIWAFLAIGFLSGFSERFSRRFLQLAERNLGGSEQSSQVTVAANATVGGTQPERERKRSSRIRGTRRPS